eukprot:gb/GECG01013317.1/.p1 GENE.gb/GECG01013317.1/~~gb/GECG01013317.1/.p1  ORF type:complete len:1067 (+),score=108.13 gb/GECG01013317.1/:1-3201(+)
MRAVSGHSRGLLDELRILEDPICHRTRLNSAFDRVVHSFALVVEKTVKSGVVMGTHDCMLRVNPRDLGQGNEHQKSVSVDPNNSLCLGQEGTCFQIKPQDCQGNSFTLCWGDSYLRSVWNNPRGAPRVRLARLGGDRKSHRPPECVLTPHEEDKGYFYLLFDGYGWRCSTGNYLELVLPTRQHCLSFYFYDVCLRSVGDKLPGWKKRLHETIVQKLTNVIHWLDCDAGPAVESRRYQQRRHEEDSLDNDSFNMLSFFVYRALPRLIVSIDRKRYVITALVDGLTGAGKSTIINMILGHKFLLEDDRVIIDQQGATNSISQTAEKGASTVSSCTSLPCAYRRDRIVLVDSPGWGKHRVAETGWHLDATGSVEESNYMVNRKSIRLAKDHVASCCSLNEEEEVRMGNIGSAFWQRENVHQSGRQVAWRCLLSLAKSGGIIPDQFASRNRTYGHKVPSVVLLHMLLSMSVFALFLTNFDGSNANTRSDRRDWNKPARTAKPVFVEFSKYLKPQKRPYRRSVSPLLHQLTMVVLLVLTAVVMENAIAGNLRDGIINGFEPCFRYTLEKSLFEMNCSILEWTAHSYGPTTYISLRAHETFDGSVSSSREKSGSPLHDGEYTGIISLTDVDDFQGLFVVDEEVTNFDEAPSIRNVHVRNGTTAHSAGFIVKGRQKYFIVDSCSSTGNIKNERAGGISGFYCGSDNGEIKISNSYSTGKIMSKSAGGIAGRKTGSEGGIAHIIRCHSTGKVEGKKAGGICGWGAGTQFGNVYITQSYSTGEINANKGGGIMGGQAGYKGYVCIQECYSTGRLSASNSGGISGIRTANGRGEVHIIDCYTRGDVDGRTAGGILGDETGGSARGTTPENFGDVHINNTYASGTVKNDDRRGGLIGYIEPDFTGHIVSVQYSVYNIKIVGNEGYPTSNLIEIGNSDDLQDIRGKLYHHQGSQKWSNDTWVINGTDELPILRFQLEHPNDDISSFSSTATPTATPTATSSRTETPTMSSTTSPSPSSSGTASGSPSPSGTSSASSSPSKPRRKLHFERKLPVQRPAIVVQQNSNHGKERQKREHSKN